jgi:hypothetical protein
MTRKVPARLAIVGSLLALTALTGCQAGQKAATAQPYNPVDGRNVNVPDGAVYPSPYMAVRDAIVVSDGDNAALVFTLVNNSHEDDALESATLQGKNVILPGGPIGVPIGQAVNVGSDGGAVAGVLGLKVPPGHWADLSLSFAKAGQADFQVLVVPPDDKYVPDAEAAALDLFETKVQQAQARSVINANANP